MVSSRTVFEVRDNLQNVAVCIERLWSADAVGRIPARVQDEFGVNENPGGNSLVQCLAESSSGRHVCEGVAQAKFVTSRIYIPKGQL